jgi:RNA polymerase sigma-70 factor (ECF subfamily)
MPSVLPFRRVKEPVEESPRDNAEVALVARAQADPAGFAPLYAGYLGPVYRYCFARLGTKEAAEDATSVVFAKALAALPRFDTDHPTGSFRTWLFTIAHRVVVDEFRGRRPLESLDAAATLPDADPTPEEYAVAADERRALWNHLAQLTPEQRRVVELRLAGLTDQEIAGVLGRSHGAIRMAQFRAIAQLRILLGVAVTPGGTN